VSKLTWRSVVQNHVLVRSGFMATRVKVMASVNN
jgi:hypothetical protein